MVKPAALRQKTVGTRVTAEEYAKLEAAAGGRNLSEWVRDVLFAASVPAKATPAEEAILSEVLASRSLMLTLLFKVANGQALTEDEMRQLIADVDAKKSKKAQERLSR
jgi:hypothetical protein